MPGAASASTRRRTPTRTPRRRWRRSASSASTPTTGPTNAEVDNTDRTFDVDRGQFTDSEDYDESEPAPFSDPEDPNQDERLRRRTTRTTTPRTTTPRTTTPSDEDSDDDSDGGVQLKVLLTGSAGSIGTVLQPRLATLGHDVVGADLPGRGGDVDLDCTDHVAVDATVEQVRPDAIIHLAGISTESSLPDALVSHVVSTGALLEAMVRHERTPDRLRLQQPRSRS